MRIGRWTVALGIATLVIAAGAANAAKLCQKKSGVVVVRTDDCRKKELPLDLAQFGALGPKGDKGDQGDKGDKGDQGDPGQDLTFDTTLASGQTLTGIFAGGGGSSAWINVYVDFRPALVADLDPAHTVRLPAGTPSATHCPGVGQAEAGYFCLYEIQSSGISFNTIGNPVAATTGTSRLGANVFWSTTGSNAYVYGAWALTAP